MLEGRPINDVFNGSATSHTLPFIPLDVKMSKYISRKWRPVHILIDGYFPIILIRAHKFTENNFVNA